MQQGRKSDASGDKKNRSFAPTGYSDTKLMNGLFAKSIATKFQNEIQAYAVCPGKALFLLMPSVKKNLKLFKF